MLKCVLEPTGSVQGLVASFCENTNKPSLSLGGGNFLNQLLKEDPVPWSYLCPHTDLRNQLDTCQFSYDSKIPWITLHLCVFVYIHNNIL
jgi:hypothetical protein